MRRVRKDLAKALALIGRENDELSILFVGSRRMKHLNALYRGVPKETDVLSFVQEDGPSDAFPHPPAPQARPCVLGDIVISVPKAAEQAKDYGTSFHEELRRLLIHGLLHLIGHDHEQSRRRRTMMEKKERELLHALQGMD